MRRIFVKVVMQQTQSFQAIHHSVQVTSEVGETGVPQSLEAGCFEDNVSGLYKEHTKNICASIVAKLQESGMANSVFSTIVIDLEELATGLHSQVKQEILSAVPKDNPIRSTLEGLDKFENPFVSFNTETKRTRYFNEKWGVVEPVEIMLGHRFDTRQNKKNGTYDQVQVKDTCLRPNFGNNPIHVP